MRKIESQMLNAIQTQTEFNKGNTCVELLPMAGKVSIMECDLVARVYLHGNHIATYNRSLNQLDIMDCGYSTVTTKSRLNALLSEFAPAWRIVQRDWEWFRSEERRVGKECRSRWWPSEYKEKSKNDR